MEGADDAITAVENALLSVLRTALEIQTPPDWVKKAGVPPTTL